MCTFYDVCLNSSENEMFQIKFIEKIKTHILCSIPLSENCAVWDNVRARQATDHSVIQCIRFARWIAKATDSHPKINTYCFSTATIVMRMPLNLTFIRTLPPLCYVSLCCYTGQWLLLCYYCMIPYLLTGKRRHNVLTGVCYVLYLCRTGRCCCFRRYTQVP
jgi:hypothetical protein